MSEDPSCTEDLKFMARACELALQAERMGEVPVGAVLVLDDTIIGEGYNQPITLADPSAHAEIQALRAASRSLDNYRLPPGTTMYVTLEPCAMCAGALVHARVSRLVFATEDPKTGACGSVFDLVRSDSLNHQLEVQKGVMARECGELLRAFFKQRR